MSCTNKSNNRYPLGESKGKLRLNMVLEGETARMLVELRVRGIVRSYADGVNQAIQMFHNEITERDLRSARFQTFQAAKEETG